MSLKNNKNIILIFLVCFFSFYLLACDETGDYLRGFGEKSRQKKASKLHEKEIKNWKRDLDFNRAQSIEIHKKIHNLVQNSQFQGRLSWKIAKAYMESHSFDMASSYMNEALKNKFPENEAKKINFDLLLPELENALRRHNPDSDLLFDAGLCYANASKARGWENKRWLAAQKLFTEMLVRNAKDGRALYQLALLYGKTKNRYMDKSRAISYLDKLLIQEDKHIPGRFARAHILVELGELDRARNEYIRIQEVLLELEKAGVISNAKKSYNFKQAKSNIEKLDICLSGSPGCEVLQN